MDCLLHGSGTAKVRISVLSVLLLLASLGVARPAAAHLVERHALFGIAGSMLLHPVIDRVRLGDRDQPSSAIRDGLVLLPWSRTPRHGHGSKPVGVPAVPDAPWWQCWPGHVAASVLGALAALAGAALVLARWLRSRLLSARQRNLQMLVAERTREIEAASAILLRQVTIDELTGLLSRSAILARLEDAMVDASRAGTRLGIALLDLDHFKRINDSLGHLGGDAVLRETGRRILASLRRNNDLAGRYGGEELLLVLPGLGEEAPIRLETLRQHVFSELFMVDGHCIRVACSIGVTWLAPGDDATAMIRRADAALYRAKREGRDQIVI